MAGCFIGVVGPSGAGKDSLIDAARQEFGESGAFRFVRRTITRPAEAGGEEHDAVDLDTFLARRDQGMFALSWNAHDLCYGIPADIDETIAQGRSVVANLSRGVIDRARLRYPIRRFVVVTAETAVLAARLAARGRESAEQVTARLRRAPYKVPSGTDVVVIRNDGALTVAQAAFIRTLQSVL